MHHWPACALHKAIQSIARVYAEPNQRSVQQSILSPAPVTIQDLARTTQAHWTSPAPGGHGSADRYGETALPHSSKLSSPLVEPVAYPLGFSYCVRRIVGRESHIYVARWSISGCEIRVALNDTRSIRKWDFQRKPLTLQMSHSAVPDGEDQELRKREHSRQIILWMCSNLNKPGHDPSTVHHEWYGLSLSPLSWFAAERALSGDKPQIVSETKCSWVLWAKRSLANRQRPLHTALRSALIAQVKQCYPEVVEAVSDIRVSASQCCFLDYQGLFKVRTRFGIPPLLPK